MTEDNEYSGSARLADGSRVEFTAEQAKALWEASERASAKLATDMPTEGDALREMMRAYERLKQLGWRDAVYCPKDGSMFDAIEIGSTGIHRASHDGKYCWIHEAGDLWPSRPILFRLDPEAETARQQKMADAIAAFEREPQI